MDTLTNNLRAIHPQDVQPRFDWERHLPALGTMAVDFEERVNYRRLQENRFGRARCALEGLVSVPTIAATVCLREMSMQRH